MLPFLAQTNSKPSLPVMLSLPLLSLGLAALLLAAVLAFRQSSAEDARKRGVEGAATAMAAFSAAAWQCQHHAGAALVDPLLPWLRVDALEGMPMAFFTAMLLMLLLLAPKRDVSGQSVAGMLLLSIGTIISYAAENYVPLLVGWWLTVAPFALGLFGKNPAKGITTLFLSASALVLTAGMLLLHDSGLADTPEMNSWVMVCIIVAVALRKGLFPLHSWLLSAFEHGPLLPIALLFNSHLGALLIARPETAHHSQSAEQILYYLSIIALLAALLTSLRGFAERKPRRLLALICLSQASFILAGMTTANELGITGGLLHWLVVSAASTGLLSILRILEVRIINVAHPEGHLGLAVKAPRLASFFFICAVALVGLPGTLGYCAEDLLFHGALESHPWLGFSLLIATAFNAINLLRLFGLLFLGVLPKNVIHIPDALPRERWPLTLVIVFLIAGGLLPTYTLALRNQAAEKVTSILQSQPVESHH
jgi:NADH-quinone oxidoreductase subunit M